MLGIPAKLFQWNMVSFASPCNLQKYTMRTKHSCRTFTLKVDAPIPNVTPQPMYSNFCWLVGLHVHYLCKRANFVHMIT